VFRIYESCLNSQVSGHLYPLVLSSFLCSYHWHLLWMLCSIPFQSTVLCVHTDRGAPISAALPAEAVEKEGPKTGHVFLGWPLVILQPKCRLQLPQQDLLTSTVPS